MAYQEYEVLELENLPEIIYKLAEYIHMGNTIGVIKYIIKNYIYI
jgi:hypothetical protein